MASQADPRPIGVFDSGIGGLTVLKELISYFPYENFIYLGDTARLPYGSKSPDTIRKYSEQNVDFLISNKVKAVVIACNSASTQMLETEHKGLPLYNVIEPGAAAAVKASINLRIGVLGTRATVQSQIYDEKIKTLSSAAQVFSQACPLFVPLAEEGWIDDPITNLIVFRYLQNLKNNGVDTIVLGCTHYPILRESIARVSGGGVTLVDSGAATALRLKADLDSGRWIGSKARTRVHIAMTDGSDHFMTLAKKVLQPYVIDHFDVINL
jgi:glutamate racemase